MRLPGSAIAVVVLSSLLAGCGQKGPLYLRESPPPNVKRPNPDAYRPVPYPQGAPADPEPDAEARPR